MAMNQDAKEPGRSLAEAQVTGVLMDVIVSIPESGERLSPTPELRSAELIKKAATTTAGISGGAALVPGPLGLLTILPDMYAIWRLQARLVAGIAAVYGKTATLGKEQIMWCLFKHSAAHVAGDVEQHQRHHGRPVIQQPRRRPTWQTTEPLLQQAAARNNENEPFGREISRDIRSTSLTIRAWLGDRP